MDRYLLNAMNEVAWYGTDPWARNFARSILSQSMSRRWEPSPKQLGVMRRLVADLRDQDDDVIEVEVVDE